MAMVHGWTSSLISKIWRTVKSGKGKEAKDYKKNRPICKKDYTIRRKVFQLSFKGMKSFYLNMEHDEVYGVFNSLKVCMVKKYYI